MTPEFILFISRTRACHFTGLLTVPLQWAGRFRQQLSVEAAVSYSGDAVGTREGFGKLFFRCSRDGLAQKLHFHGVDLKYFLLC